MAPSAEHRFDCIENARRATDGEGWCICHVHPGVTVPRPAMSTAFCPPAQSKITADSLGGSCPSSPGQFKEVSMEDRKWPLCKYDEGKNEAPCLLSADFDDGLCHLHSPKAKEPAVGVYDRIISDAADTLIRWQNWMRYLDSNHSSGWIRMAWKAENLVMNSRALIDVAKELKERAKKVEQDK